MKKRPSTSHFKNYYPFTKVDLKKFSNKSGKILKNQEK